MPKKFKLAAPRPLEKDHQATAIDWVDRFGKALYPDLEWLYAVPNGANYGGPNRYKEAGRMKMLGLRRGVPDLCLPVARGGFHGLYIEMKRDDKEKIKPGSDQERWICGLARMGYSVAVCYSGQAAIDELTRYILLGTRRTE